MDAANTTQKRCYIIGGGTTVSAFDIKSANYTIGCNAAFLDFPIDMLVLHDWSFMSNYREEIEQFNGVGGIFAPDTARQKDDKINSKITWVKVNKDDPYGKGIYNANNCGVFAISLAIEQGFNDICLVGMDCRHEEDRECILEYVKGNYTYQCEHGCSSVDIMDNKCKKRTEPNTKRHYHDYYGNTSPEFQLGQSIVGFRALGDYIKKNRPDVRLYILGGISIIDYLEVHGYDNVGAEC